MIDTNVILSAVYKRGTLPDRAISFVSEHHEMVLCDYVIQECHDVIKRRFPQHTAVLDELLAKLSFEIIIAPRCSSDLIIDQKDAPILNAAIKSEIDIIISGDKHFLSLKLERPKVLSPSQFMREI